MSMVEYHMRPHDQVWSTTRGHMIKCGCHMRSHDQVWVSHEVTWSSVEYHEVTWSSVEYHMRSHDQVWVSHEVTWSSVEYQWGYMIKCGGHMIKCGGHMIKCGVSHEVTWSTYPSTSSKHPSISPLRLASPEHEAARTSQILKTCIQKWWCFFQALQNQFYTHHLDTDWCWELQKLEREWKRTINNNGRYFKDSKRPEEKEIAHLLWSILPRPRINIVWEYETKTEDEMNCQVCDWSIWYHLCCMERGLWGLVGCLMVIVQWPADWRLMPGPGFDPQLFKFLYFKQCLAYPLPSNTQDQKFFKGQKEKDANH